MMSLHSYLLLALPANIAIACCAARITRGLRRSGSATLWLRRGGTSWLPPSIPSDLVI